MVFSLTSLLGDMESGINRLRCATLQCMACTSRHHHSNYDVITSLDYDSQPRQTCLGGGMHWTSASSSNCNIQSCKTKSFRNWQLARHIMPKNKLECGPMSNVMGTLGIQVAPSIENDEEWKFRNSIPCTMPQSLADAHCSSIVQ